jgi:hypothetical protein
MTSFARIRSALLTTGLALVVACTSDDPKSPTAPRTTPVTPVTPVTFAVTVASTKSTLEVNTSEFATITVTARRTDNGAAPPNLTPVTLTTTIGAFGAVGGPTVVEGELVDGQFQTVFFPGAVVGTATLRAQVGSSVGFGSIRVAEAEVATFFIGSVTPNVGGPLGGEEVTIHGGGFDEPLRVLFGGIPATIVSSSGSQIRVLTPALVTSLDTCGTNPANCNQTVSVSVTINLNEEGQDSDTLANAYSYSNGGGGEILQPIIFSVTPATGPNEGGTQVAINGDGFEAPVQVEFGKGNTAIPYVEAQIVSVTRTRIVVLTPPATAFGQANLNQLIDIRVTNLNTGRFAVASNSFRYGVDVRITSIGPGEGPSTGGQQVTLFGQGFDEPVAVGLANVAQQVLSVSGTEIVVLTVPVTITNCSDVSGPSSVTNIETGDSATGPNYIYRAPKPIITGVSPTTGGQGGGTNVTISGVNFTSPVVVEFQIGGQTFSAQVTSVSSTAIVVKSPAVPSSVFTTQPCDVDADGTLGTQAIPTAATIKVTSPLTGCTDDFTGAFLYTPAGATCVGD